MHLHSDALSDYNTLQLDQHQQDCIIAGKIKLLRTCFVYVIAACFFSRACGVELVQRGSTRMSCNSVRPLKIRIYSAFGHKNYYFFYFFFICLTYLFINILRHITTEKRFLRILLQNSFNVMLNGNRHRQSIYLNFKEVIYRSNIVYGIIFVFQIFGAIRSVYRPYAYVKQNIIAIDSC